MWNKIKEWFKTNWKSFVISFIIIAAFLIIVGLLPKWAFITIVAVAYFAILSFKIWKNKPF